MKDDFKIGDKVEVIKGQPGLPTGSIHTVHDIYERNGDVYVSLSVDGKDNRDGWDIDRFVKYEEKGDALKIDMQKKYRMVGTHEPVRIICVDRVTEEDFGPIVGLVKRQDGLEAMIYLDSEGHKLFTKNELIEEVPEVEWSKVQVDTPIWIRFPSGKWGKRHFQAADVTGVYFWPDGKTSFTCDFPRYIASYVNCVAFEDCSLEEPK